MTEGYTDPTRPERQRESHRSVQPAFMPSAGTHRPWAMARSGDLARHMATRVRLRQARQPTSADGGICRRLNTGEGVDGRFYGRSSTYLFIGEHSVLGSDPLCRDGRRLRVRLHHQSGASVPGSAGLRRRIRSIDHGSAQLPHSPHRIDWRGTGRDTHQHFSMHHARARSS